jgi:glycerophosphoryl diester phosphodiesterase
MMKNTFFTFLFFLICFALCAQPKVIAHRGYWHCEGSAENSLTALHHAHTLNGLYASELDVQMTVDGVVVVNHDPDIEKHVIETSTYKEIKDFLLPNGEKRPTLKQYLRQARKDNVRLIIEIKEHNVNPAQNEQRVVDAVRKLVRKARMQHQVEYISFSMNVCTLLKEADSTVKVAYLPRKALTPKQVKAKSLDGIDYRTTNFDQHPEWVKEAQALGLTVNVYNPVTEEALQRFIDLGVDFITTDNPVLLLEMLKK